MGGSRGFRVTLTQVFKPKVTGDYPEAQAPEAGALPRPSRPQPLRGRDGEVHRVRAVRRRVPGAVHLRARRRQPARRARVARRALRLRLRDQLPALHPLRSLRRGVPDRGDHRDEALRVLVHEPQRRDLHQATSSSSTTTAGRAANRGSCGSAARTTTRARGCEPRRRPGSPRTRAASPGRVSSGSACREPAARAEREMAPTLEPLTVVLFFVFARSHAGGRARRRAVAQSRALGALARAHARERRGAVPDPGRGARRRGAGDRLRGRDRRAVPVRDHAARRRSPGDAHRAPAVPAARSRSRSAARAGGDPVPRRPHLGHGCEDHERRARHGRWRRLRQATSSASHACCSPTSSGRSRSPRCCWSSRWSAASCSPKRSGERPETPPIDSREARVTAEGESVP